MEIINRYTAVQSVRRTNELGSHIERRTLLESKVKIDPNNKNAVDGALLCETTDSDDIDTSESLRPNLLIPLKRELGFRALGFDFVVFRKTYARVFAGKTEDEIDNPVQ